MKNFFSAALRVFVMFGLPFLFRWISPLISPWITACALGSIILFSIITLLLGNDRLEGFRTASISFIIIFIFGGMLVLSFLGCLMYVICVLLGMNLVSAIENNDPIFSSEDFFFSKMVIMLLLAALTLFARIYGD